MAEIGLVWLGVEFCIWSHFSPKSCWFSSIGSTVWSPAMKKSKVILLPEILNVCFCESNVGFYFSSLEAFRIFSLPWYSVISMKMCIGVNLFSSVELLIDGFLKCGNQGPWILGNFLYYFVINFFPSTDLLFLSGTSVTWTPNSVLVLHFSGLPWWLRG